MGGIEIFLLMVLLMIVVLWILRIQQISQPAISEIIEIEKTKSAKIFLLLILLIIIVLRILCATPEIWLKIEEMRIKKKQKNPTEIYYHTDHLGSVVILTDKRGKKSAEYEYSPFGEVLNAEGERAKSNLYLFAGKEFITEAGYYNFYNRFYDPRTQRFLEEDPIISPEYFNKYSYAGNNPITKTDPFGDRFYYYCSKYSCDWYEFNRWTQRGKGVNIPKGIWRYSSKWVRMWKPNWDRYYNTIKWTNNWKRGWIPPEWKAKNEWSILPPEEPPTPWNPPHPKPPFPERPPTPEEEHPDPRPDACKYPNPSNVPPKNPPSGNNTSYYTGREIHDFSNSYFKFSLGMAPRLGRWWHYLSSDQRLERWYFVRNILKSTIYERKYPRYWLTVRTSPPPASGHCGVGFLGYKNLMLIIFLIYFILRKNSYKNDF